MANNRIDKINVGGADYDLGSTNFVFDTYAEYQAAYSAGDIPVGTVVYIKEGSTDGTITALQVVYNNGTVKGALDELNNDLTDITDETEWYGTCTTTQASTAKVATLTNTSADTTLKTGQKVVIKFTYSNTANSPTLNVNNSGAKAIQRYGNQAPTLWWVEGDVVEFVYTGSVWQMLPSHGQIMRLAQKPPESVSVTADGAKTMRQLLDSLYSLIDWGKAGTNSHLVYGANIYTMCDTQGRFASSRIGYITEIDIKASNSVFEYSTNMTTPVDQSTVIPTSGTVITFVYGLN